MILRTCRGGLLARSQQFLQKVQPAAQASRRFSTEGLSIFPKEPLDGINKFILGSCCFGLVTVGKVYYDFFQDEKQASLNVNHEVDKPVTEKVDEEKVDIVKVYQDHLKSVEEKYENDLREAQTKALDIEARAKQLEKEVEELKARADEYAARLQEIEEDNAHAKEDAGKIRLVNEITEIKRQIENLGLSGTDLDKSHLLHKLAMVMGIFAFENAVMNGDPLEKEVEFFQQGADSLIIAAISALPEDAIKQGSLTPAELQKRFLDLKPKLHELVSNSASGDDANSLDANPKENEDRGIEAVFEQVESFIKEGKLTEAASVLEQNTQGTQAQDFATEWAKGARLRASVEQVHNVLRAHAATITMSLA